MKIIFLKRTLSIFFVLLSIFWGLQKMQAQERFRSEAWEFERRARVRDLSYGDSAQRYATSLGVFFQAVNRDDDDLEDAIDTMDGVYDDARSRVRTDAGRRELVLFESMLGWMYMGLAETTSDERDREDAARIGLNYLNTLLRENSNNLDLLFIYVRATWFVPTTYNDLTADIQYAGERYLSRASNRSGSELDRVQRNVVLIALANVAIEENDEDKARQYFDKVDRDIFRVLEDYGCGRLGDVYQDIDQTLRGQRTGRIRTSW